jgi:tetratricopeptide (TPR) repeat protein
MKTISVLLLILILPVRSVDLSSQKSIPGLQNPAVINSTQSTPTLLLGDVNALLNEARNHPDSPEAHFELGLAYLNSPFPNLTESREEFKRAIELKPDYAEAYNALGYAYHGFQIGLWVYGARYKMAVKAHQKAIALRPDYAEAYLGLGIAYWELEHSEKAIDAMKQAIYLNPDYYEAYTHLSFVYHGLHRYQEAIEAHQQMIRLVYHERVTPGEGDRIGHWQRPQEYEYLDYNQLGRLYTDAGQYENAMEAHQQAIRLKPDEPMLYHNLGLTYLSSGDKGSALAQYNLLVEMEQRVSDNNEKEMLRSFSEDLLRQIQRSG